MMTQSISLGDLVHIKTGKLDANASSIDGIYPFFTCAREPLKINKWAYDLDAILVAGNGDLNVKHYKGRFEAYQRTYILSIKNEKLLSTRYLYYFMDSYLEELRKLSIGGVIKYIKLGMLTDAKIPLPRLDEQQQIAAILDQADALRRARRRAIERLNDLGQAIFYEMFGGKSRSGWKTGTLNDVLEVRSSLVDPKEERYADFIHVGPEHINSGSGEIEYKKVRTVREDGVISGKYEFNENCVLYSKIRPYLNKVALPNSHGLCSADMYALDPIHEISTREFIKYTLMSREFLSYTDSCSGRANIPKINLVR